MLSPRCLESVPDGALFVLLRLAPDANRRRSRYGSTTTRPPPSPRAPSPAELAQRSLRRKCPALAEALTGRVTAHHRFLLAQLLRHIECLDDAIATCDGPIETCTAAEATRSRGSTPCSWVDVTTNIARTASAATAARDVRGAPEEVARC